MTADDLRDFGERPPFSPSIGEFAVLELARREAERVYPFPHECHADMLDRITDAPSYPALRDAMYAVLVALDGATGRRERDHLAGWVHAANARYQARRVELDDLAVTAARVRIEMQAFDREVSRVMREQNVSHDTARWVAHTNAKVAREVQRRRAVAA